MRGTQWMMRLTVLSAALLVAVQLSAQYPAQTNTTFERGERLEYAVFFHSLVTGNVKAGTFEMEVTGENKNISGRNTYHYIAKGESKGTFSLLYRVNDRYESFTDELSLLPLLTLRRISESDYIRNQDHIFDRINKKIVYKDNLKGITRTLEAGSSVHDILSAVYYLRNSTGTTEELQKGFQISYVFNDSIYNSSIQYIGIETIQTSIGKISCIKLKPQVLKGKVFNSSYPLTLWVSNDKNRIPILVESDILLGSIRVELINWTALKNPFDALK